MSSISPNGSEDRLQQLECTKNQSLQHLQSEKELQTRKLALLKAKTQELRRLQQRCFKLEKKSAKLSDKILNKEEEIENLEAENKENASKLRVVTREIGEAEEERKQKLKYYDLQRQEIQKFEEEVEKGFSTLQSEVESLETTAAKMESAMANMRDGEIYVYGNDWENSFEAEIGTPLSETKRKLSSKLASSHSTKRILEQQLESTLTAQDDERNKLLHAMEKQKSDLCLLQRENQDLEEKVFEAMRKRDDRKKELENINNRIAELTNLKCRFVFALTIL